MYKAASAPGQDALLGRLDLTPPQTKDLNATMLEELAHELRQPLGIIESIAYFLELTAEDEQLCSHLQRIQAMVLRANAILDQQCGAGASAASKATSC
jgi:signal transduction histidine kinase